MIIIIIIIAIIAIIIITILIIIIVISIIVIAIVIITVIVITIVIVIVIVIVIAFVIVIVTTEASPLLHARIILCDITIYTNINMVKQHTIEHNTIIFNKIAIIIIMHACSVFLKFC